MGFVGNYAPSGLPPQMYDMPVIHKKGGKQNLVFLLLFYKVLEMLFAEWELDNLCRYCFLTDVYEDFSSWLLIGYLYIS